VTVALCALAACTGETGTPPGVDTSTSLSSTPSEATPSESQTTTISVALSTADVPGVGTVLVEQDGRTVYLFMNDTGSKSTCSGSCAATWPALTSDGRATTTGGANGTLGTTKSTDGGQQVTYDGHPLYLYSGDNGPGEANGQGIGGVWYAVTPDGKPAKTTTTAATVAAPALAW
jgi:predicted lipoprotein with Yx(FWY)xxD motif